MRQKGEGSPEAREPLPVSYRRVETRVKNEPTLDQVINDLAAEVNTVLDSRIEDKYFQEVMVLHSFLENILTWLLWTHMIWNNSGPEHNNEQDLPRKLTALCETLTFREALKLAYAKHLISSNLYKKLNSIRTSRNNLVHQLWLYSHRNDPAILRCELETLADVSNQLITMVVRMNDRYGLGGIYDVYLPKWDNVNGRSPH